MKIDSKNRNYLFFKFNFVSNFGTNPNFKLFSCSCDTSRKAVKPEGKQTMRNGTGTDLQLQILAK